MLFDNTGPRYLPHIDHPEALLMGLKLLGRQGWIETDNSIAGYLAHKRQQRDSRGEDVYRASEASLPAQDDPVLLEPVDGSYRLTAASLFSPSHWRLREKFNRSMRTLQDLITGFHNELSPKIDRFFDHLKPEHPVVRFNWAIQTDDALAQLAETEPHVSAETPRFYRAERQSLPRLLTTGAIAFTIRVCLHPLEALHQHNGAMTALLTAVDVTLSTLKRYKDFDRLEPALARYRD